MGTTIYDIAKKCHCSTTTVSKVFNNSGKISEEKAKLIRKTAEEMGYTPNASARFVAGGAKLSRLLGVILQINEDKGLGHELFSRILNSFRMEAEKQGYDICFLSRLDDDSPYSYLNKLESRGCSGVFALSARIKEKKIQELYQSDIPVVSFDYDKGKSSISSNNEESVAELVNYLVKLGHRRICYVHPDDSELCLKRKEGFILGLKQNNIPFDERMVVSAPFFSEGSAQIATDKALASGINPTAIMYPDDYCAINAIPYLRSLGYKVPRDISITGFDGIEVASIMRPSITTIGQDAKALGREAARLLLAQIENPKVINKHIVIPAHLQKGESTRDITKEDE